MNSINLIGRIATELELKNSKDVTYIKFNLAVPRQLKKDVTDFIPCVAFGKLAELIDNFLKKGDRIAVNGQLLTSHYEVSGEKKTAFEVNVANVDFLENRKKSKEMTEEEREKVKGTLLEPKHDLSNSEVDDEFPF